MRCAACDGATFEGLENAPTEAPVRLPGDTQECGRTPRGAWACAPRARLTGAPCSRATKGSTSASESTELRRTAGALRTTPSREAACAHLGTADVVVHSPTLAELLATASERATRGGRILGGVPPSVDTQLDDRSGGTRLGCRLSGAHGALRGLRSAGTTRSIPAPWAARRRRLRWLALSAGRRSWVAPRTTDARGEGHAAEAASTWREPSG